MIELIFIIIIGVSVYRSIQRKRGEDGVGNTGRQIPPPPTITISAPPRRDTPPAGRHIKPPKAQQQVAQSSAIEEAKKDGNATTAYLMEKAEADAREHAREKFEEQKRLYETRGGLAVAQRHLDGDPIPRGNQCVKCRYCGAENLLPMVPKTQYSCYFCREAL